MIYQVKDNKKIPLGTQFDNSWQIEYDRDLSSQLVGKDTWTATEDCWFQYNGLWVRNNGSEDIEKARDLKIKVNGAEIQTRDSSGTSTTNITVLLFGASALMKKGDVVTFINSLGTKFDSTSVKVFPIHRILSKDDGHYYTERFDLPSSYDFSSRIVTIDTSQLFKGDAYTPYQITACIGSDADIFAFSIIAYKIWNGDVYYSTVINRVGVIQAVTNTTITYKIGGTFANVTASAIKL